jgi:uncharacterized membrane protein HdeD (DUF308 family)
VTASAAGRGATQLGTSESAAVAREAAGYWWLWLVTGVIWVVAALVVLQFDTASIATIGVIVGCMFAFAAVQQFVGAAVGHSVLRWIFGGLFAICAVIAFIEPRQTFAGLADTLGFLFLCVGVVWTIEAFAVKEAGTLWWLGLVSGVLMIILAFWTSGQFWIEKAYLLLVFAGIWALMHGVGDIVRAFRVRSLRDA